MPDGDRCANSLCGGDQMSRRIDAETRAAVVAAYLENGEATYKEIGKRFGINPITIGKIIKKELAEGRGIVPDRRAKPELPSELDQIHEDKIDRHPHTSNWMEYITPLHKHKQELELAVEHRQAELEKAKQELRDFTATLRQLMGEIK